MLQALDQYLALSEEQQARTILRSDSGFGSDGNVNEALYQQWQVVTKGTGGRRPLAVARQVDPAAWQELRPDDRWVALVADPPHYVRPVQFLALRWRTQRGDLKHSTIICSILDWPLAEVIRHYDARGACETEIQADKGGLKLCRRRKKSLPAQEVLILLTDLAHNLLAWATTWMFPDGPLAAFGPTQMIEDTLAIPGRLRFNNAQLIAVELNARHPYAAHVAGGLERLLDHFGYP